MALVRRHGRFDASEDAVQEALIAAEPPPGPAGDHDDTLLDRLAPNPMARLSHAAAVGMASGPHAGLARLDALEADGALQGRAARL